MTFPEIKTASFLAFKTILRGSRSTSLLLIFVLSLSFLNILFVSGMLYGLQRTMIDSIINLFSSDVTISAQLEPRVKVYIPDQNDIRAQIQTIPGVIATVRHYLLAGSIGFDKLKNGTYRYISGSIVAIDPKEETNVLHVNDFLLDGKWLEPGDRDQIVLSSALAGGYGAFAPSDLGGVRVGDKVRITFSNGTIRQYTVKGIYNDAIGLFETFLTIDEAENVLAVSGEASQILVRADLNKIDLTTLSKNIHTIAPTLTVQPYTVLLGSFDAFLKALDLISAIVSAISVLVVTITMFALIYVNAASKRKQIGILKAIGLKKEIIILSYVIQSVFYAICGTCIGALFIYGVLSPLMNAYPIDIVFAKLGFLTSTTTTSIAVISLLAASIFAGYVPSWSIVRGSILKAIQR